MEDSFSMEGWGDGSSSNASNRSGSNGSDGESQMKICLLASRSPPDVGPGS